MPVEVATHVADLNSAYPLATEQFRTGDDHIRLIKATLLASFPSIDGPVTATDTQLNNLATWIAGSYRAPATVQLTHLDLSGHLILWNDTTLLGLTSDRNSSSTTLALTAKALNDHSASSDHDGRYYTETEVNALIAAASATAAADVAAVEARSIIAGSGLTGGGTLSASRTLSVDGTVVRTTNNSSLNDDTRNTRGVSRLYRSDENNDFSVQTAWTATYAGQRWALRGYGPSDTFHADCWVANADHADTAANCSRSILAGSGLTGGGALTANRTISHADTSTQASVNNAAGTVIQDVTLDGFGHVTNLASVDLDARYILAGGVDPTLDGFIDLGPVRIVFGRATGVDADTWITLRASFASTAYAVIPTEAGTGNDTLTNISIAAKETTRFRVTVGGTGIIDYIAIGPKP